VQEVRRHSEYQVRLTGGHPALHGVRHELPPRRLPGGDRREHLGADREAVERPDV